MCQARERRLGQWFPGVSLLWNLCNSRRKSAYQQEIDWISSPTKQANYILTCSSLKEIKKTWAGHNIGRKHNHLDHMNLTTFLILPWTGDNFFTLCHHLAY